MVKARTQITAGPMKRYFTRSVRPFGCAVLGSAPYSTDLRLSPALSNATPLPVLGGATPARAGVARTNPLFQVQRRLVDLQLLVPPETFRDAVELVGSLLERLLRRGLPGNRLGKVGVQRRPVLEGRRDAQIRELLLGVEAIVVGGGVLFGVALIPPGLPVVLHAPGPVRRQEVIVAAGVNPVPASCGVDRRLLLCRPSGQQEVG